VEYDKHRFLKMEDNCFSYQRDKIIRIVKKKQKGINIIQWRHRRCMYILKICDLVLIVLFDMSIDDKKIFILINIYNKLSNGY